MYTLQLIARHTGEATFARPDYSDELDAMRGFRAAYPAGTPDHQIPLVDIHPADSLEIDLWWELQKDYSSKAA